MTAQRFRKKPTDLTAIRWTGDNTSEIRDFADRHNALIDHQDGSKTADICSGAPHFQFLGLLEPGDWIAVHDGFLPWAITDANLRASWDALTERAVTP